MVGTQRNITGLWWLGLQKGSGSQMTCSSRGRTVVLWAFNWRACDPLAGAMETDSYGMPRMRALPSYPIMLNFTISNIQRCQALSVTSMSFAPEEWKAATYYNVQVGTEALCWKPKPASLAWLGAAGEWESHDLPSEWFPGECRAVPTCRVQVEAGWCTGSQS